MDEAAVREQTNMADFIKANIQLQQSFSKLQETLRLERNQSVELQHRLSQTIVDQQRRIEDLEKEIVDHHKTSTAQQQRIVELERVGSNLNETILCYQQKITELDKEIVDHNRTRTVQQQKIDELEKTDINHNETITGLQQTINVLEKEMVDHYRTSKVQQQRIAELGRTEIHHNTSLSVQQRLMRELQDDKLELNKTLIIHQQKLDYLESTGININRTFHLYQTKVDSRMNQSFGAYQVILHGHCGQTQPICIYVQQPEYRPKPECGWPWQAISLSFTFPVGYWEEMQRNKCFTYWYI